MRGVGAAKDEQAQMCAGKPRNMANSRSKRNTTPRRKRFNRRQRLDSARNWLPTYKGDNIAQAYRKHFGIDWLTAFKELELLGIQVDPSYKEQVLKSAQAQAEAGKRKRTERRAALERVLDRDQDERFAYIAGYTNWGFPYGLTWEELEALESESESDNE
jgi:hypothetical protein